MFIRSPFLLFGLHCRGLNSTWIFTSPSSSSAAAQPHQKPDCKDTNRQKVQLTSLHIMTTQCIRGTQRYRRKRWRRRWRSADATADDANSVGLFIPALGLSGKDNTLNNIIKNIQNIPRCRTYDAELIVSVKWLTVDRQATYWKLQAGSPWHVSLTDNAERESAHISYS